MKENKSSIEFFKKILYIYLIAVFFFSLIYILPFFHTGELSYIDSLFLSTSALSVTGLSTINVYEALTTAGQTALMIEMQIGGVGILVLISYLFLAMGKQMTVTSLWMVKRDQNQSRIKTIGTLGLSILILSIVIETIGFLLMYPTIKGVVDTTKEAIFTTIFHSISSFTNGGFTLFENGLIGFQHSSMFIIITGAMISLGALGYPTLMEYIFNFRGRKTLFTKINIRLHFGLLIASAIAYLIIEWNNTFKDLLLEEKIVNALFLSSTTRSGGLNTVETAFLDSSTILLMLGLMFIGGASTSTAGGIRLTTFAVIVAKLKSVISGNDHTVLFKKTISNEVVNKAFLIFTFFILLFFTSTLIISFFETLPFISIVFETMSALTNTGLSRGITDDLGNVSKIVLMMLMLVGRIGILSLIYLVFKINKKPFKYIEEDLIVG